MKLSQILKYSGIVVGGLGALKIIYAELGLILSHPIALLVMGAGALTWFIGVWEAKHEAAVAAASTIATASKV